MHRDKGYREKLRTGLGCNHLSSGLMDIHSAEALDNRIIFKFQPCFCHSLLPAMDGSLWMVRYLPPKVKFVLSAHIILLGLASFGAEFGMLLMKRLLYQVVIYNFAHNQSSSHYPDVGSRNDSQRADGLQIHIIGMISHFVWTPVTFPPLVFELISLVSGTCPV